MNFQLRWVTFEKAKVIVDKGTKNQHIGEYTRQPELQYRRIGFGQFDAYTEWTPVQKCPPIPASEWYEKKENES